MEKTISDSIKEATKLYITGFGKFGNILVNPTTVLVNHLKTKLVSNAIFGTSLELCEVVIVSM